MDPSEGFGRSKTSSSDGCLISSSEEESSSSSVEEDSTYYNEAEGSSIAGDVDEITKMMTLQSIDRLEHHLPQIVVVQLIADMKNRKEEATKQAQSFPLLSRGSMTLEVPMISRSNNASVSALSASIDAARRVSMGDNSARASGQAGINDLLNTLSSLDELLEEEFSSSGEESSSEEEEDSDEETDGDSEEDSHEEGTEENKVARDEYECSAAFPKPGALASFIAEDAVSDIGVDDGVSDIDDLSVRRFDLDDEELTCASSRGAMPPAHSFSMMECGGSIGSGQIIDSISTMRGHSLPPSTAASRNGSACGSRSFGKGSIKPEHEVGKLRQGRLSHRRHESDATSDDRSMSVDLTTLSTKSNDGGSMPAEVQASHHVSAILFVDISGFTKLSRSLEVETLSEIINSYFQMIVSEITAYGGDILKFAGDALIIEWTKEMLPQGYHHLNVTLLAALCSTRLVDRCSDFPVSRDGKNISTLNLHCALGYGAVVGAHCGDMDRMEYLILGDSIRQIADAMGLAKLGEVVASPQAMEALADCANFAEGYKKGHHHTLAFKKDRKFRPIYSIEVPFAARETISKLCQDWSACELDDLQRRMSRYVHSVVYADEFSREEAMNAAVSRQISIASSSNAKSGQAQSELRDVFTVFIQPRMVGDVNDEAGKPETLQLLNSVMLIVNSEVTHHKAHLRQFIVDDKGLVVIANFGLRGSTFPNMIEERAIPCISNIRTLLKTELDLECTMGATYGNAYCGVVGGHTRHEYAILGPSVNLAARLMASASNPGILVDEVVKGKAGDRPFKALPPVKAKGYDNLVKIYNPNESIRKAWKNVEDEFVGRKENVFSLLQIAESILVDPFASKTVFVSGPCGIGKSYLLSHATQRIEDMCSRKESGYHLARIVCCEDDSFRPFSIVRPLFMDMLRRKQHVPSFGDSQCAGHTEELGQRSEVEEAQLYVSLLQICLEAKIPMQYIEMFGGLIFSTKLSDIGTWSDRSRKMSEWTAIAKHLVTAFLHCTNDYGLVLLSFDDVSGMDEMSWKILQRLYEKASNLMVIATARNEFDLNINGDFWADLNEEGIDSKRFLHLRMSPMGLSDVGELACRRLCKAQNELDETISKTVTCQSRGNPLLACEILDVMYTATELSDNLGSEDGAMTKVEELLLNRLDELQPVDRAHLNLGAILGFTFAEEDIVLVMEKYNDVMEEEKARHAESVHSSLQESANYGILKRTDIGSRISYSFSHALWMKTIAKNTLDAWKDGMRKLIDDATSDSDISIKYDWDELTKIKDDLSSMRQQNHKILQSISELRALIDRAR